MKAEKVFPLEERGYDGRMLRAHEQEHSGESQIYKASKFKVRYSCLVTSETQLLSCNTYPPSHPRIGVRLD